MPWLRSAERPSATGRCSMPSYPSRRRSGRHLRGLPSAAALLSAVAAAKSGADQTVAMAARRGRSSYLGDRALGHIDPGAAAVVVLLEAVAREVTAG